jgi:hypothetical protein
MLTLSPPSPRLRLALLGGGIIAFIWLGFEDNSTLSVAVLGALLSVLSLLMVIRTYGPHIPLASRIWIPGFILLGALMGAGAVLFTVILMFFKTAWHSHAFPDYPVPLMAAMLARLPLWTMGGGCIGAGVGLWRWAKNA